MLLALKSLSPSNEVVQQTHNNTSKINKTIEFLWVQSHIGIKGNEKVDLLANKAISSPLSTFLRTLIYQDKLNKINSHTAEICQTTWDKTPITIKLKEIKKSTR